MNLAKFDLKLADATKFHTIHDLSSDLIQGHQKLVVSRARATRAGSGLLLLRAKALVSPAGLEEGVAGTRRQQQKALPLTKQAVMVMMMIITMVMMIKGEPLPQKNLSGIAQITPARLPTNPTNQASCTTFLSIKSNVLVPLMILVLEMAKKYTHNV